MVSFAHTCIRIFRDIHVHCIYMINTQTLEKDKGKIYKSNPKAITFQRKIAASGGT